MSKSSWMCVFACAGFVSAASAQTTITFVDPSGLEAEAEFSLAGGGTQLQIRLRNVSTGVPMGFLSADQLLTSVGFDLGAPGANPGDPAIVGGSVATGPTSQSLNFDVMNVGASADVSGEWGFGNGGTTNLPPNFVSAMTAGATPFGGANLDGPVDLNGPQGGLVPSPQPIVPLGGIGAIQDEVVATVDLDQALADLGFLENGVRVEFGSDAAFLDGCDDCECDELASATKVNDAGGLNAPDALCAVPGSLPTLGNASFAVQIDDPTNACHVTPGSFAFVAFSPSTFSFLLPRAGCLPGMPGEVMIDPTLLNILPPVAWAGPGQPAVFPMPIPSDPATCGIICYGQGLWVDRIGDTGPFILTNRLDLKAGL